MINWEIDTIYMNGIISKKDIQDAIAYLMKKLDDFHIGQNMYCVRTVTMEEPTRIEQKKKEWRDNNQLATLRKEALIYTHIEEIGNVINDILIYKIELENLETVLKEMLFLVGEGNCIIFSREELGKEALTSFVQDCFAVTNRIISLDLEQMHYWGEETGNKLIRIYNKNGEDLETAFVD